MADRQMFPGPTGGAAPARAPPGGPPPPPPPRATVVLVTHRPAIVAVADRLVVLHDGRIQRDGTPAEVTAAVRRAAATPSQNPPPAGQPALSP